MPVLCFWLYHTTVKIKQILVRCAKSLLHSTPKGVQAKEGAYIYRPRRIEGGRFIHLGNRATIDKYSWISAVETYAGKHYKPMILLGDDVHIGRYSCLTSILSIIIEEGCLLSEHVYISDLAHGLDPEGGPMVEQPLVSKGAVRIGKHSFIGYRACIMPGVTLGKHCVVGANSVVTRSFPEYSMIAGCPARLVKRYCGDSHTWVLANGVSSGD